MAPAPADRPHLVSRFGREVGMTPGRPEGVRRPVYGPFYGLSESPFDLTPNPRFLFLTPSQQEALSNLIYGLTAAKGLTLVLGDAGTGKTTLVRTAMARLGDSPSQQVLINNPTLSRSEFYESLTQQFGLPEHAASSKAKFLTELQRQVEARFAAGGLTGLIIDEAQSLPHELLEEVRLLGNIETPSSKLLNIVLTGQPELADRLNEPGLRQLKQRVALRCELRPFSLAETASYISGRIRIAGGSPQEIFTREAVMAIHAASHGIPRIINVLCDNALVSGYAAQVRPIPVGIVADACRDFDLKPPAAGTGPQTGNPAAASAPPREDSRALPAKAGVREDRPMFGALQPKPKRRFSFFS
jgi:general secretion pathway protein A